MDTKTRITLGGVEYVVPLLDVDQMEAYLAHIKGLAAEPSKDFVANFKSSVAIAAIVFRDADPEIGDIKKLRVHPTELRDGIRAVLALSGLIEAAEKAPSGEEQAAAAAA
jgi:hypothetical protein